MKKYHNHKMQNVQNTDHQAVDRNITITLARFEELLHAQMERDILVQVLQTKNTSYLHEEILKALYPAETGEQSNVSC